MKEKIKYINGLKKYIKLTKFLPEQCGIPLTATVRQKINGKSSGGKPLSFSDEELEKITIALSKWSLNKSIERLKVK